MYLLEKEPATASTAASTAAPTTAPTAFAAFLVAASIFASVEASIFTPVDAPFFPVITKVAGATHICSTFRSVLPKDIGCYSICGY